MWSATFDTPGFSNERALAPHPSECCCADADETKPDDAAPRQVGTVPLLPSTGQFEIANVSVQEGSLVEYRPMPRRHHLRREQDYGRDREDERIVRDG